MKTCLGHDRISPQCVAWCNEPATFECFYWEGHPTRHYRCEDHLPDGSELFALVRPLVLGQLVLPGVQ